MISPSESTSTLTAMTVHYDRIAIKRNHRLNRLEFFCYKAATTVGTNIAIIALGAWDIQSPLPGTLLLITAAFIHAYLAWRRLRDINASAWWLPVAIILSWLMIFPSSHPGANRWNER